MENIEIIYFDIDKQHVDEFFKENIFFKESDIKSSHFYDHRTKQDKEFSQIESIAEVLSPNGTGSIVLKKLLHGIVLEDIVITLSFSENDGEIVINFPESSLLYGEEGTVKSKCISLLEYLTKVKEMYNVPKIRIGYEPATDDDTCLIEILSESFSIDNALSNLIR